ncbi:MAG: hypothetical protein ACRELY_17805 [Polyangiaceae bacterium]
MTSSSTFQGSARCDHLAGSNWIGSFVIRGEERSNWVCALVTGGDDVLNFVWELPTRDPDCVSSMSGDFMQDERDDTTVTSRDDDATAAVVKRVGLPLPALTLIWSANTVGRSAVESFVRMDLYPRFNARASREFLGTRLRAFRASAAPRRAFGGCYFEVPGAACSNRASTRHSRSRLVMGIVRHGRNFPLASFDGGQCYSLDPT